MRLYLPQDLNIGQNIVLQDEIAHRLLHVMRVKLHEKIILFNGTNTEYTAHVSAISRRKIELTLEAQQSALAPSPLYTHLVQAISRPHRMDYTLQKATELGVNRITPLMTAHTSGHLKNRHAHWQGILISSAEQCGRSDIPLLDEAIDFRKFFAEENADLFVIKLILLPNATTSLYEIKKPAAAVKILIGNEGGFSVGEEQLACAHEFQPIRLGPRILRTETTAPVVLGCLQYLMGDF